MLFAYLKVETMWIPQNVAWEPLLDFRKLVLKVLTFQGTLELVGNFPNPMGTVPDGWELIGNFYPLKLGT